MKQITNNNNNNKFVRPTIVGIRWSAVFRREYIISVGRIVDLIMLTHKPTVIVGCICRVSIKLTWSQKRYRKRPKRRQHE